ncbi:hypothetical protein [Streptomyces sp. NPDC048350]|uniref:hypothetical protein n=1 Tax=Streptomyces sp. NPDC048350 TaxID=3365538 RepID=UPI00371C2901
MNRAKVTDVFIFANGDSAVYIDPAEGDFRAGDRVKILREGAKVAEVVLFPRDGSVVGAVRADRRAHALVKEFVCVVGDMIEAE